MPYYKDIATRHTVSLEKLETLDVDTVTGLLQFRFKYLTAAGIDTVSALMQAATTDRSLAAIVAALSRPVAAAA